MSADDLFALPPEGFVAARDELAKRLRTQGDREEAARVRQLRRPTVPAWAVDQLAREHGADLDGLLEAGAQLRDAQQEALAGRGAGLRAASARRRELIDGLTEQAATILADSGRDPAPHRAAIAATLEAATVDDEAAEALRAGTLTKELSPPAVFGDLAAFPPEPDRPAARRPKRERAEPAAQPKRRGRSAEPATEAEALHADEEGGAAEDARRRAAEAAEAERRDREAERAAEEAETERRSAEAERVAEEARQRADQAAAEVERLEAELARARREAAAADKQAVQAAAAARRKARASRKR